MAPQNAKILTQVNTIALRTIETLPQDDSTKIARIYCKLRAAGIDIAQAELRTSNDAKKVIQVSSVREKNILVRSGIALGAKTWQEAYLEVMGDSSDSGIS